MVHAPIGNTEIPRNIFHYEKPENHICNSIVFLCIISFEINISSQIAHIGSKN